MKKVISAKQITIILISLVVIIISTSVNATNPTLQLGNNDNKSTQISENEYDKAQTIQKDENKTENKVENKTENSANKNNTANKNGNNTKVYNTNKNTDLPQTGIEDYNVGILLIICITSAIFAYKKINDYKNI